MYQGIDLAQIASDDEIIASVYNEHFRGYVHVYKDGRVVITSPAGTMTVDFRLLDKQNWLRENYIRMLVESGIQGEALQNALAAIERVDRRLATGEKEPLYEEMLSRSEAHFQTWCAERGIDYETLTDEEVMELSRQAIKAARRQTRATGNS